MATSAPSPRPMQNSAANAILTEAAQDRILWRAHRKAHVAIPTTARAKHLLIRASFNEPIECKFKSGLR